MDGSRVTDVVDYHRYRGKLTAAIRVVRTRRPEALRWRAAVGTMLYTAGHLGGKTRSRVEEPIREVVLDLSNKNLQTDVVLDGWQSGIDLDRGEIFPFRNTWDLRRISFGLRLQFEDIQRYAVLPEDSLAPINTAGIALLGRRLADFYRYEAQKIFRDHGHENNPSVDHHRAMTEAYGLWETAEKWSKLSRSLCDDVA